MRIPDVFKNKNFTFLYIAGFTSELGSFALNSALLLYIYKLSDQNSSYMGISQAIFIGFFILGSLIGGAATENKDKRSVLLFCEIVRIPIVCALFFTQSIPLILLLKGGIAFFTGVFNPSRMAFINYIVPKENITKANSVFGTTFAILHILGPILGTQLYALTGGPSFVIGLDLISYLVGILLLIKISYRDVPGGKGTSSFLSELKEGFNFANQNKDLLSILCFAMVIGTCIGVLISLFLPFTTDVLKQDPKFYGYIISSFGTGGLLGGFVCHYLSQKINLGKIIIFSIASEVIMMFTWINIPVPYVSLVILFFWGTIVFCRITAQLNYISTYVPSNYLTRTHSLLDMAINVPQILGGSLVGFLGSTVPTLTLLERNAFMFLGLVIIVSSLKGTAQLYKKS